MLWLPDSAGELLLTGASLSTALPGRCRHHPRLALAPRDTGLCMAAHCGAAAVVRAGGFAAGQGRGPAEHPAWASWVGAAWVLQPGLVGTGHNWGCPRLDGALRGAAGVRLALRGGEAGALAALIRLCRRAGV